MKNAQERYRIGTNCAQIDGRHIAGTNLAETVGKRYKHRKSRIKSEGALLNSHELLVKPPFAMSASVTHGIPGEREAEAQRIDGSSIMALTGRTLSVPNKRHLRQAWWACRRPDEYEDYQNVTEQPETVLMVNGLTKPTNSCRASLKTTP